MARLAVLLTTVLFVNFARAESDIEKYLKEFHNNPSEVMERLPDEIKDNKVIPRGKINYDFVTEVNDYKQQMRLQIMGKSADFNPMSAFDPVGDIERGIYADDTKGLVENSDAITQIFDIDSKGLSKFTLPPEISPWNDSYWPLYKGNIATRYADPGFPASKDWATNYSYVMSRPASAIAASGNRSAINNLSPAEKYDLLVGDYSFSLTRFAWSQGRPYQEKYGKVPTWMGICNGWSGAAMMLAKNITQPVVLRSPNGIPITFYQSDIKALNSMAWAHRPGADDTRFIGNRCSLTSPPKNGIGRILDPKCWDNNPATYYLSLVNQIGRHKRSFVMDSTYDAQVWNFAITGYTSQYFNPQSMKPANNIRQAIIPIQKYTLDKFKEFRSPKSAYVVGVAVDVGYVGATNASHKRNDKQLIKTYRYYMDLELDSNFSVIGGEWYTNAHPDFIWTYAKDFVAAANVEKDFKPEEWDVRGPVPSRWTQAAQRASDVGIPLHSVLQRIVDTNVVDPDADDTVDPNAPREDAEGGAPAPRPTPTPAS